MPRLSGEDVAASAGELLNIKDTNVAWSYRDITPNVGFQTTFDITPAIKETKRLKGLGVTGIETSAWDPAAFMTLGISDPASDETFFIVPLIVGYYGPMNPLSWDGDIPYDTNMILRVRAIAFSLVATRIAFLLE